MKSDNKLRKLRFDPNEAFGNLRKRAQQILQVSKQALDKRVVEDRHHKRRNKIEAS